MKTPISLCRLAALATAALSLHAAINIPSNGLDGDLVITTNEVIDLSRALTVAWDTDRSGANWSADLGKGVYDSNKWAVVFHYRSVQIAAGATVTFANHPSRAPVVWLVQGDVTIDGVLSLDGQTGNPQSSAGSFLAEPGPGGFRGGPGFFSVGVGAGPGFGPGGGQYSPVSSNNGWGRGGSFGTSGSEGPDPYGNPSLLPLIGGSGGGGYGSDSRGGGAGGGAILIASQSSISVEGEIWANGGGNYNGAGSGSGGAIRLVAHSINGTGSLKCLGKNDGYFGGLGRIRIEGVSRSPDLTKVDPAPDVLPLVANATPLIWLPENGPTAAIVSVGGKSAPRDPLASFGAYGADVALSRVETVPVVVVTTNVPEISTVTVRVTPRANGRFTETIATNFQTISTTPLVIQWTADVPVNTGYSAVQVKVRRP